MTYRPGSRNTKPDALSRQFLQSKVEVEDESETILPSTCVLAAVSRDVEALVRDALRTEPEPSGGAPHCPQWSMLPGVAVGAFVEVGLPSGHGLDTVFPEE